MSEDVGFPSLVRGVPPIHLTLSTYLGVWLCTSPFVHLLPAFMVWPALILIDINCNDPHNYIPCSLPCSFPICQVLMAENVHPFMWRFFPRWCWISIINQCRIPKQRNAAKFLSDPTASLPKIHWQYVGNNSEYEILRYNQVWWPMHGAWDTYILYFSIYTYMFFWYTLHV